MTFIRNYLISYNVALAFGWSYVLFKEIISLVTKGSNLLETYNEIEKPLKIVQTIAILEV